MSVKRSSGVFCCGLVSVNFHHIPPGSFHWHWENHYNDVIMTTIASQIISLAVVYSTVYSDADQRKHQSSASLAFVWGIHRDRWIPRKKGQLRGKCFHLMTSSCHTIDCLHLHSAPTGARNSSLGHPNMAEASLGKNFPKMIPSLLRVFNGSYLQGLVIWCVSLSRPQNFLCKRRHIARRGGDISSRDARISTFVQLLDALNSFQGCPRLTKDARISPTSSPIDARVSKENSRRISFKNMYTQKELWCFIWMPFPTSFKCMPWILWPRFVSLQ